MTFTNIQGYSECSETELEMETAPLPATTSHDPTSTNEITRIKRIVGYLELRRGIRTDITALAQDFGVKRRGLYELITICGTFGICRRYSSAHVEWLGIDQAESVLNTLRQQCREENEHIPLCDVFNNAADPSIQRLAVAIIKMFFFLRVKFLDLRKVGRIFAQGITKYKTMLRKLYTVAGGLEIVGLIRKTKVVSEIQLVASLDAGPDTTHLNLQSILNTQAELNEEQTCDRRRQEFEALCTRLLHGMRPTLPCPPGIVAPWK
jgi:hypothetical protein